MAASIRAVTNVDGNTVTLTVTAMTTSPPPFRVVMGRRGATVIIKKGGVDIAIDLPADAKKPATVTARGRVVCDGPGAKKKGMTPPPPPDQKARKKTPKTKKKTTSAGDKQRDMTPPPPPDQKSA